MNIIIKMEDQELELNKCFIGGILADGSNAPVGIYNGDMTPVTSCMTFEHGVRAFIKCLKEGAELGYDDIEVILRGVVQNAMKMEKDNLKRDNLSVDEHTLLLKVKRGDKQ